MNLAGLTRGFEEKDNAECLPVGDCLCTVCGEFSVLDDPWDEGLKNPFPFAELNQDESTVNINLHNSIMYTIHKMGHFQKNCYNSDFKQMAIIRH